MKVAGHHVAATLSAPSRLAGILLHGEDAGRIRDHAAAVTQAVLGATTDPFRLAVLTREEHGRLREEAGALALGGGRRVVRVQDATDGLATVVAGLPSHTADTLLVLEGSTLAAKSKLRAFAEKSPDWAAIACYPEHGAAVTADIRRMAAEAGLAMEPGALAFLTQELGGDSARRRAEFEKLALYCAGLDTVTLEDAQACCASRAEATLGAMLTAALTGQADRCDRLLEDLGEDGVAGPAILALLNGQVQRLLKVRLSMQEGRSVEEACQDLRPPVFPRQMAELVQEVRRWSIPGLLTLAGAVREADIACKRAASPDFAIAGRLLGVVAARAASKA